MSKPKSIGHYTLGPKIGSGTFGYVRRGIHTVTGQPVAVKILEKERICDASDVERVSREIHILKMIRHPHIIQLYEIVETSKQLYLIMEYAPSGELFDYIVKKQRLDETEACRFFHQILSGIEVMHTKHVCHRDLKPENLLLDDNQNIKIVDFGLSNTFTSGEFLNTACGSPCYAAPEMITGNSYDPRRSDIWSTGVILFAMIVGHLPFEDPNTSQLYRKITAGHFQIPSFVSESAQALIRGMLCTDPSRRMTVEEIKGSRWYQGLIHSHRLSERPRPLQFLSGQGCEVPSCTKCKSSWGDTENGDSREIDEQVLAGMTNFEFPLDYVIKCLKLNKHNHATTTYYLLLEKRAKEGKAHGSGIKKIPDSAPRAMSARRPRQEESALLDPSTRWSPPPPMPISARPSASEFSIATPDALPRMYKPTVSARSERPERPAVPVSRLPFVRPLSASTARAYATPSPSLQFSVIRSAPAVPPPRYATARTPSPGFSLPSRITVLSAGGTPRRRLTPSLDLTVSSLSRPTAATKAKSKPPSQQKTGVGFGSTTSRFGGGSGSVADKKLFAGYSNHPARSARSARVPLASARVESSARPVSAGNFGGLSSRRENLLSARFPTARGSTKAAPAVSRVW